MALIGLNPSTATEEVDDPTVKRCWKLAKREGFDAFCMLNLFALRSTDPQMLYSAIDPVGSDNDKWLLEITKNAGITIGAWGNHGALNNRGNILKEMIPGLKCLGVNKSGHPKHPLYLRSDVEIFPFL
jgi:hypothetical protein